MTQPNNWLTQRERLRELHVRASQKGTRGPTTDNREAFYRAAHEAVPQLLAEVERLEAENEKMRDGYAEHHDITATQMAEVQTACWKAENERDALRAEVERLRSGWREDVTGCVEQVDE